MARATAKPPMADSRIVPFMDRLMTPARSEIVSPMTPKSTGAAAVRTPARPTRMKSRAHARRLLPEEPLPGALPQEDESTGPCRTPARDESSFSTMGSWMLPTLSAAKKSATGAASAALVVHEHRHHESQVAVAAGDRGDEPVVDGGHLDRARKPGKDAAQGEGDHHVLPGGDAQQVGGVRVPAHRLQPQPEVRAPDQEKTTAIARTARTSADGLRRDCAVRVGSQSARGNGTVPDMEATPGRFQGPKISQRFSAVATKFSPSPPKISFTPPKVFSAPASMAQRAPPTIPARMLQLMMMRGVHAACLQRGAAPTVVKMAPRVIWPSIPMFHRPDGEGDEQPGGDQEQRHPGDQDVGQDRPRTPPRRGRCS